MLVAVGLYFPFWYSARQTARTRAIDREPVHDDAPDLLGGDDPRQVALRAWGALVGGAMATFLVLAAVYALLPNPLAGASFLYGAVALWSVFISIIALPHILVGSLFDQERGIWYVP